MIRLVALAAFLSGLALFSLPLVAASVALMYARESRGTVKR